MARLKKALRPLTRKRQIDAALELLKPPADKREQYRHTIEQALDSLMARSEVDRATKKAKRAWTAALESMQAACVTCAAAGGDPWVLPQKVIDRAVELDRMSEITQAVLPLPWSKKQYAIVLAYDLLLGWGHKIKVSVSADWHKLAKIINSEPTSLYRQLHQMLPDIRSRPLEIRRHQKHPLSRI
jgi:hypothetical protein